MEKIRLWSVDRGEGRLSASAVESVDSTETEQDLEELFVVSPDLLMDGLTVIGRQIPTDGGPLDLLGVDPDGRLVVFELKKGTLTREAVAQALDYAADLAVLDHVTFGALIEKHSGRRGVDLIEDFADWYRREHPGGSEFPLDRPSIVLVGLGVDDRARRIVDFLAESRVDIRLLTFHAFSEGGRLFLARQVESRISQSPVDSGSPATKESNLRILHETAKSLMVDELLTRACRFIEARIPGYCYPGKQAYSYSLQETTAFGNPSLRSYATLYVNVKKPGTLTLAFPPRAAKDAEDAVEELCSQVPGAVRNRSRAYPLELTFGKNDWTGLEQPLDKFLAGVVERWKRNSSQAMTRESPDG